MQADINEIKRLAALSAPVQTCWPGSSTWNTIGRLAFDSKTVQHRVDPSWDRWADLKKAYAEGKPIPYWSACWSRWFACPNPLWSSLNEYCIDPSWVEPYKYQAEKDAFAAGAEIQSRSERGVWYDATHPCWLKGWEYRVKLPFQKERDAFAEGNKIQVKLSGYWLDIATSSWDKDFEYRMKPAENTPSPSELPPGVYKVVREGYYYKLLITGGAIPAPAPVKEPCPTQQAMYTRVEKQEKYWAKTVNPINIYQGKRDNLKLVFEGDKLVGAKVLK